MKTQFLICSLIMFTFLTISSHTDKEIDNQEVSIESVDTLPSFHIFPQLPKNAIQKNKSFHSSSTLPKHLEYGVEKDGIVTPKGAKYHILITSPDTTKNWKILQMPIPDEQKFHILQPKIE
ncbi:MAG: hypothetical protein AAFO82_07600 [Bacteroidota bacterium]